MVEPVSQDDFDQMWNDKDTDNKLSDVQSSDNKTSKIGITIIENTDDIPIVTLHYAKWCKRYDIVRPEWEKFKEIAKNNFNDVTNRFDFPDVLIREIDYSKDKNHPAFLDIIGTTLHLDINGKCYGCLRLGISDYKPRGSNKTCVDMANFVALHIKWYKDDKIDVMSNKSNESNRNNDEIIGSIVLHYADWCAWSNDLLPEWEQFEEYARINLKMLKVNRINYSSSNPKKPDKKLKIIGYPTIILRINDSTSTQKRFKLEGGDKSYTDIVNFVTSYMREYM
jgi:hypothetical protein